MKRRSVTLCLLAAVASACGPGSPETGDRQAPWLDDFEFGTHSVGFRTTTLTRSTEDGPREMVLAVWYPAVRAQSSEARSMSVRDYFRIVLAEGQLTEPLGLVESAAFAAAMTGDAEALSPEDARTALDTDVFAHADATAEGGPFPLVLWSSRHATVLAQAPLAEVVASHGFVVATVWSSDPPLAFAWEERSVLDKRATLDAQTLDLVEVARVLGGDGSVQADNIAVLAWSYGGQTATRIRGRKNGVRGIVALDANVLPTRPEDDPLTSGPLVFLLGRDASGRGMNLLSDLAEPWIAARFPELAHGNSTRLRATCPLRSGPTPSLIGPAVERLRWKDIGSWSRSSLPRSSS